MYDRNVVPRQPWHDFGVQLVGQPARDMSRHFIQRWVSACLQKLAHHLIYLNMQMEPLASDQAPFACDAFSHTARRLYRGRSREGSASRHMRDPNITFCWTVVYWHSQAYRTLQWVFIHLKRFGIVLRPFTVQNAYIKAIQLSEAFVYIENQYFSSSSVSCTL